MTSPTANIPAVKPRGRIAAWAAVLLLQGCGGSGDAPPVVPPPMVVDRVFEFAQGSAGWVAGSADYSASTAPTDVVAETRALPAPFTGSGFFQSGTNRSDDLFLYIKTPVTGLVAGTTYRVRATIDFLTDVPSGCVGVGGAPGESVWVVLAASSSEPLTVPVGGEFRLNIDRGNQSQGGPNGIVLGNVANSVPNCGPPRWEAKALSTPVAAPLAVKADAQGSAWLLVGFDSGFEALSRLYYQRLTVRLEPN